MLGHACLHCLLPLHKCNLLLSLLLESLLLLRLGLRHSCLALLRRLLCLRLTLLGRALLRMLLLVGRGLFIGVGYPRLWPHLLCCSCSIGGLRLRIGSRRLTWVTLLRVCMLHGHLLGHLTLLMLLLSSLPLLQSLLLHHLHLLLLQVRCQLHLLASTLNSLLGLLMLLQLCQLGIHLHPRLHHATSLRLLGHHLLLPHAHHVMLLSQIRIRSHCECHVS